MAGRVNDVPRYKIWNEINDVAFFRCCSDVSDVFEVVFLVASLDV